MPLRSMLGICLLAGGICGCRTPQLLDAVDAGTVDANSYCSFTQATDNDGILIAVTDNSPQLLHRDGSRQALTAASMTQAVAASVTASRLHLGVLFYDTTDATNQTATISVFDKSGHHLWERSLNHGFSGRPWLDGLLSDGTVIVDLYDAKDNKLHQERLSSSAEVEFAAGGRVLLVDDDWVLIEFLDAGMGNLAPNSHYVWQRPATREKVAVQAGWSHVEQRLFIKDASVLGRFVPGQAKPQNTVAIAGELQNRFAISDGGGDLLVGETPSRVWRVTPDLAAASVLDLPQATVGLPILRKSGGLFAVVRDPLNEKLMQPIYSSDSGKTIAAIGTAFSDYFGGDWTARGNTAAMGTLAGITYVVPAAVQIFYGAELRPQILPPSNREVTLSPDGECVAYYRADDADPVTWQLVIRDLRSQAETQPPITTSAPSELRWWF